MAERSGGDGPHPTFLKLAAPTREPGFHHLRLRADITYRGAGANLPQEIRSLADVTYALYDPDRQLRSDAAHFVLAPSRMTRSPGRCDVGRRPHRLRRAQPAPLRASSAKIEI